SRTATLDLSTLSLHDALPILVQVQFSLLRGDEHAEAFDLDLWPEANLRVEPEHRLLQRVRDVDFQECAPALLPSGQHHQRLRRLDRKSTRLNSSHVKNSYAVF